MQKIKMLIVAILIVIFFLVFLLPSNRDDVLRSQVESLPDFNFIAAAKLESGDPDEAITLLDIAIENNLPRGDEALALREKLVKNLLAGKKEMDEIRRHGFDDDERRRSWETAAGASVTEAIVEADGDKLVRQLKLNEEGKALLKTLSPLGVLKDLWPVADDAVVVMVAAHREGALTPEMRAGIIGSVESLAQSKEITAPDVKQVLDQVVPVWELLAECPTWTRFKTFMSFVENQRQLTTLLALIKNNPLRADDLHQILAVVATEPRVSRDVLGYLVERGAAGVDAMRAVIRKGPVGFDFLIEHPAYRPSAPLRAPDFWGGNVFKRLWLFSLGHFPITMEVARYVVLWLVGSVVILLIVPDRNVIHACGLIAILLLLVFVFNYFANGATPAPSSGPGPPVADASGASGAGPATVRQTPAPPNQASLNALSMLVLLVIIFIQFAIYMRAVSELKAIKGTRSTYEGKLKQLENVDIFFDLPLYLGLLGTVTAFVIIIFDPGASRLVAYTSTIAGIIISALLRVFHLYPYRAELITHIDQYQKFKAENR